MIRSVTRQIEPEWDDHTRGLAEGLTQYDHECCPDCRLHESVLNDPERNAFTFDESFCKVCAAQVAYGRWLAAMDAGEAEGKKPADFAKPGDGRHVRMRRMTADEIAARHTKPPREV